MALVAAVSLGVGAALQPVVAQGTSYLTQAFRIGAATPYNLTWPADDGTTNGILQTDGSGALAWATDLDVAGGLDVANGIEAGSGDVALVGADGKLNGPLSSTILDDLSGANLTALNASNLGSGTMPMARQPANVIVDLVTDWEATEQSTQSTTTWSDTGLSATITVDNATNDLEIDVWQTIEFSTGSVACQLRLVAGTSTVLWTSASVTSELYHLRHAYRHTNPGSGSKTYKTQFIKTGGVTGQTCYVNSTGSGRSRGEAIMQIFEIAN